MTPSSDAEPTLLARAVKGGLTQAGIQLGTDPVVQWLSIKSRVQEGYDPVRTATSTALGIVGGSATSALAGSRVGRPTPSSPHAGPSSPRSGILQPPQPNLPKGLTPQKLLTAPIAAIKNHALTGDPRIDHRVSGLLAILSAMKQTPKFRSGSGKKFGIAAHAEFAKRAADSELGIPKEWIEHSFKAGGSTKHGRKGSVRTDIILRDESGKIIAIIDLKTRNAKLTAQRIRALVAGTGASEVPVIELKYNTLTAVQL